MSEPIECQSCGEKVAVNPIAEVLSHWEGHDGAEALVKITAECPECRSMALDIEGVVDSEEPC